MSMPNITKFITLLLALVVLSCVTSWDSGESRSSMEPYSEKKDIAPTAVLAPSDSDGSKRKPINDAVPRTRGGGISPAAPAAATMRPYSEQYPDCRDDKGRALCDLDSDCDIYMSCPNGAKCVNDCSGNPNHHGFVLGEKHMIHGWICTHSEVR